MEHTDMFIDVIQGPLVAYAVRAFAEDHDAPPDGGHLVADGEVDTLEARRVALPAVGGQPLLDRSEGAAHHAVTPTHQAPPVTVLTTCAQRRAGSGISRGVRTEPVAWRRGDDAQRPTGVRNAVVDSLSPSVSNRGTPSGATLWAT